MDSVKVHLELSSALTWFVINSKTLYSKLCILREFIPIVFFWTTIHNICNCYFFFLNVVHSNIVTFYFLRMMFTYTTSFGWIFDKSIYYLLVIQIRRPEEAASWGPGHSHSEDLSGVEMSHTLPADEKKPNRDGCLVQEIRGESPWHFFEL